MNGRMVARLVLALVLVGLVALIGIGAYQAGVSAGLTQAAVSGGTAQIVVPAYGWGFGLGPIFGFFGALLVLFLIFGLVRAIVIGGGRRHERWGGGWGAGWYGAHGHEPDRFQGSPWEARAREIHDEWHRGSGQPGRDSAPDATAERGPGSGG